MVPSNRTSLELKLLQCILSGLFNTSNRTSLELKLTSFSPSEAIRDFF